jgi:hypothetical protein
MKNKLKITHAWHLQTFTKFLKRRSKGHLHDKLRTSTILQNNRIEREQDIRKEQRGFSYILL